MNLFVKSIGLAAVFTASYFLTETFVYGAEVEKKQAICSSPEAVEKILNDKGYFHLLDVTMENGTKNQLWSGGRDLVITSTVGKELCLVTNGTGVVFNLTTLKKIMEIWEKSHPPT